MKRKWSPGLKGVGLRAIESSVTAWSRNHCLQVHLTQGLDLLDVRALCSGPGNSALEGICAVPPSSKVVRAPMSVAEIMSQSYLSIGPQTSTLTSAESGASAVPLPWSPRIFLHKPFSSLFLFPQTHFPYPGRPHFLRVSQPCLILAIHPLPQHHWATEVYVSTLGNLICSLAIS